MVTKLAFSSKATIPACDAINISDLPGNALNSTPLSSVQLLCLHMITNMPFYDSLRFPGHPAYFSSSYITALDTLLGKHIALQCLLHQSQSHCRLTLVADLTFSLSVG